METRLASWIRDTADGHAAEQILRACVHCGFCLATCPTYQLLGDELDGPRGRIYQIKQVLEGTDPGRQTQIHLDRCLTCRNCETTCPSGVAYGHLVEIGRVAVAQRVRRPLVERLLRWTLKEGLTRPTLFAAVLGLFRSVAPLLPGRWRAKLGVARPAGAWPSTARARTVLLPRGCTQPAMLPSIDAATARVLDAIGVQVIVAEGARCCGAIRQHLEDHAGALSQFRRNIDAWWPYIEARQIEAIISNASGCGATIREYAYALRDDPSYAAKAQRIVELTRDLVEFLGPELTAGSCGQERSAAPTTALQPPPGQIAEPPPRRIAFHPPCTLQHGLRIRGEVEKLLTSLGAQLVPVAEAHLCCGSAGTYSLLQPALAQALRERKLAQLLHEQPQMLLSANIGCIAHLQGGTGIPVRHWIEWVDAELAARRHVPPD
ncbi:MAG TPA: glycolate oxidase subunit GlcF [Steroidobacteraceae bacterium]